MKIRYNLIKIPIICYINKSWEASKNSLFTLSDWIQKSVKNYFAIDHIEYKNLKETSEEK